MPQPAAAASRRIRIPTYRVYGVDVDIDSDFGLPLPQSTEPPQLRFDIVSDRPIDLDGPLAARAISTSGTRDQIDFSFLALRDLDVVRVHGAADYFLWEDRIACFLIDPRHAALVPVHLFGMVMSMWLERHGIVTLHGAAVDTPAGAIAVLARKGGGKTSTVAALLQRGHALLTDDLLAVDISAQDVHARPAYPQLRMQDDQAVAFGRWTEQLRIVNPTTGKYGVPVGDGFGTFSTAAAMLTAIFLPERSGDLDEVEIVAIPPRMAFLEVVRHTFLPAEMADLGFQRTRFSKLAALVSLVPFRRVRLPDALQRLPDVAGRIAADAAALTQSKAASRGTIARSNVAKR